MKIANHLEQFTSKCPNKFDCIMLIGYMNTGKSTFCQLVKAHIAQQRDPDLIFEDGKVKNYQLSKVISNNTLKVQTITPRVYQITSQRGDCLNDTLLEVPCMAISPLPTNKKWTILDPKIMYYYLSDVLQNFSMGIMIEEKHTRTKMEGLKNTLESFLENIVNVGKQFYDSTAIIICKCAAAVKKDALYTRIQSCVKKLDEQIKDKAQEWFKSIKTRDAIILQYKITSEEATKDETIAIYKQLTKLPKFSFKPENICSMKNFKPEIKDGFNKYFDEIIPIFNILLDLLDSIIDRKFTTLEEFEKEKVNLFAQLDTKDDTDDSVSQMSYSVFKKMPNLIQGLALASKLLNLGREECYKDIILDLLDYFATADFIYKHESIYQTFEEKGLVFQKFYNKQQKDQFLWHNGQASLLKAINGVEKCRQNKDREKLIKMLDDQCQSNQNIQYYQGLILAIQFIFDEEQIKANKQAQNLMIKAKIQIAGLKPPKQSLKALIELSKFLADIKNEEMLGNIYEKIGEKLIEMEQLSQALMILGSTTNPQRVIDIVNPLLNSRDKCKKYPIETYVPYLEFLQSAGLVEKSYETCYKLGNYFDQKDDRGKLREYLQKSPQRPNQMIMKAFIEKLAHPVDNKVLESLISIADIKK